MLITESAGEVDEDDIFHPAVTVLIGSTDTTDAQLCLSLARPAVRGPLADPSHLDVTRAAGTTPLNFGTGIHMCLGRMITLVEEHEVVSSPLMHWSEFEVTDSEFQG